MPEITEQSEPKSLLPLAEANKLAADNIKLAYSHARMNRSSGIDPEELDSICMMALVKASRGFDPDRGFKFITYAVMLMKHAIQTHYKLSNCDKRIIHRIAKRIPTNTDGEVYQIEDNRSGDGEKDLEDAEQHSQIMDLVDRLDERSKLVIRRRFFDKKTLDEISSELGITKELVRQIELKAMAKLKKLAKTKINSRWPVSVHPQAHSAVRKFTISSAVMAHAKSIRGVRTPATNKWQRYRHRNIMLGLCRRCGRPPIHGQTLCDKCRTKRAAICLRWRRKKSLVAAGDHHFE
jgi:RNA polymerase sigma factor (sigma-70 family)